MRVDLPEKMAVLYVKELCKAVCEKDERGDDNDDGDRDERVHLILRRPVRVTVFLGETVPPRDGAHAGTA